VWGCADVPGQFKNEEWCFDAASGAIVTRDTFAELAGRCLTPADA
jgi:hypothetical protein